MSRYKKGDLVLYITENLIDKLEIKLLQIVCTKNEYEVAVVKEIVGSSSELLYYEHVCGGSTYSVLTKYLYPVQELDDYQEYMLMLEKGEYQARVDHIRQRVIDIKEMLK